MGPHHASIDQSNDFTSHAQALQEQYEAENAENDTLKMAQSMLRLQAEAVGASALQIDLVEICHQVSFRMLMHFFPSVEGYLLQ